MRERVAAAAAAPAVDERAPGARPVVKPLAQVPGDIGAHERRAELLRVEGRGLLVERADERALAVVEHGTVDRAGNVIVAVLAFGADVDHLVKVGELCYGYRRPALRASGGALGVLSALRRVVMRLSILAHPSLR